MEFDPAVAGDRAMARNIPAPPGVAGGVPGSGRSPHGIAETMSR